MKVYISATQKDLLEYRLAVHDAARRLQIDDVAMEAYGADARPPLQKCLDDVRRCDLYVGIFAWRYGYRPAEHESSITELEYRAAMDAGKPCLIFMLADDAPWPVDLVDRDDDGQQILALRRELKQRHVCAFFTNVDDLQAKVTVALADVRSGRSPARAPGDPGTNLPELARAQYYARLRRRYLSVPLDAVSPRPTVGYLTVGLPHVFVEPRVHEDARPEMPLSWWRGAGSGTDSGPAALPGVVDPEEVERLWAEYSAKQAMALFDVVSDPARRSMVLLGDPGSGKSAATRYLALVLAGVCDEPRLAGLSRHLPVLIELRSYAAHHGDGRCEGLLDYVGHRAQQGLAAGIDRAVLTEYLLQGGQALFLFDGLDEVFDPALRAEVAEQIALFANEYDGVRTLVTSRSAGYLRYTFANAGFEHFTLEDLDDQRIARFLGNWYRYAMPMPPGEANQRCQQILDVVRASQAMREIAGNPLLLMLMAIVGQDQPLPRNRRRLYAHVADVLISEWDVTKQLRESHRDVPAVDRGAKLRMLRHLAFWMQSRESGPAGNYIEFDELIAIFQDDLVHYQNFAQDKARAMASLMIDKLRQRSFILERYGLGLFGFVHRSFLEFFCAEEIVDRCERDQPGWGPAGLRELFRDHWDDPSWREVLRLVATALPSAAANDLVELLATEVNLPWQPVNLVAPPWNLMLAAQCVAEAPQPADLAGAGAAVLERVVLLIEHGISAEDPNLVERTEQEVLSALRALGPQWPGPGPFLHWYRRRGVGTSWHSGSAFGTRAAAVLAPQPQELADLLVDRLGASRERRARIALVAGLAELAARADASVAERGFCRQALIAQANAPGSTAVRQAAMRALVARFAADAELADVLPELAGAADPAVRAQALGALGGWAEATTANLDLLREHATDDRDTAVRRVAVQVLAQRYPDQPGVPEALQRSLATDADAGVVQAVLTCLLGLPSYAEVARARALGRMTGEAPDEVRRCLVSMLLPGSGTADEVELLLRLAKSDAAARVRAVAVRRLALLAAPDADCRARLIDRLERDDDAAVRVAAVETLADRYRGDPRAWEAVAAAARGDDDATVRLAAVRAAADGDGAGYPDSAGSRDGANSRDSAGFRDGASSRDGVGDGDGARDGGGYGAGRAVDLLLNRAGEDQTASVRLAAIDLLTAGPPPDARTRRLLIRRAAQERDAIVRRRITRCLTSGPELFDPEVRQCLVDQLGRDSDPSVVLTAAAALARVGETEVLIEALSRRVARDSYAAIRLAAVRALCAHGEPAAVATALLECIELDTDPAVLDAAVRCLSGHPSMTMAVTSQLRRRLADHDPAMRARIATALGEHFGTDPEVSGRLAKLVRDDPNLEVRRRAVEQLAAAPADRNEVRNLLRRLVSDTDWEIRRTALLALTRHYGAEENTRRVMLDLAHQRTDGAMRQLAARLLATLPGTGPDDFP